MLFLCELRRTSHAETREDLRVVSLYGQDIVNMPVQRYEMKGAPGVHGIQLQGHFGTRKGFYVPCLLQLQLWRSPARLQDRRRPAGGSLQQEINPVDLGASGVSNCSWVDLGSENRREFDAYTLWKWNPCKCFVHLHYFSLCSTLEMKPENNTLGDRPAYPTPGDWNRKDGIWEDSLQGGGWWREAGR